VPAASARSTGEPIGTCTVNLLRRHLLATVLVTEAVLAVAVVWLLHVPHLGHWLQVHLGIIDEAGPYYGFWSGFGSDLAELSILGAIGTGVYQQVRKFNCHQPGCWRIGSHPAAGSQFMLCYRHHPDYRGRRPGADVIERLHREHVEHQELLHARVRDLHEQLHGAANGARGAPDRLDALADADGASRPGFDDRRPTTGEPGGEQPS
jgi:hypothetical protein